MDRKEFRNEYLLNLITSPLTAVPLVGGVTALAIGIVGGFWLVTFGGFVAAVGGVGLALSRFICQSDRLAEKIRQRLQKRANQRLEEELDTLYQQLLQDDDPRPEKHLQDLREITTLLNQGFHEQAPWTKTMSSPVNDDVLIQVNRLFSCAVEQIRQTNTLTEQMSNLPRKSPARQTLQAQREQLIAEIAASVSALTGIIQGITDLKPADQSDNSSPLAQIRCDLQESLDDRKRALEHFLRLEREIAAETLGTSDIWEIPNAGNQSTSDQKKKN